MTEYISGKKYKKLKHDMRKGMRTYNDTKKLAAKAGQRRERQEERKKEKKQAKRLE